MPTGSCARISSSEAVHGRIAEKTCCSRIRRAINCVYCPPKSSTTIPCRVLTMPPRSLCAAAPLSAIWSCCPPSLSQNDVHQLARYHDYLHDLLAGDQRRNPHITTRSFDQFLFGQA